MVWYLIEIGGVGVMASPNCPDTPGLSGRHFSPLESLDGVKWAIGPENSPAIGHLPTALCLILMVRKGQPTGANMSIKLLTVKELSREVSMSKSRIYGLVAEGKFPRPFRDGPRFTRWSVMDVAEWVECKRKGEEWPGSGEASASSEHQNRRSTDKPSHFMARRVGDRRHE